MGKHPVQLMHISDIKNEAKKAFEEKLLIDYRLKDKPCREQRIVVEVTEKYFVVTGLYSKNVKVIFFGLVMKAIAIPDRPDWKNVSKHSIRDLIKMAEGRYLSQGEQVKMQLISYDFDKPVKARTLIENLKELSSVSKDEVRFLQLTDQLINLL